MPVSDADYAVLSAALLRVPPDRRHVSRILMLAHVGAFLGARIGARSSEIKQSTRALETEPASTDRDELADLTARGS